MTILALECSGRILSVALESAGKRTAVDLDEGFRHIETLLPSVETLFTSAGIGTGDIDLVACSAGPGSFTALRIGMATTKGIARGAGCPFKAVSTTEVMAYGRENYQGIVAPLMDARKGRVYAAAFRQGDRVLPDLDVTLEDFFRRLPEGAEVLVTGPDAAALVEGRRRKGVSVDPDYAAGRGEALLELARIRFHAEGGDAPDTGPLYLRKSEAEEKRDAGKQLRDP